MDSRQIRVIAFYLPQFYAFPENDAWWGKGFTEWTNVRKAKPLYRGHYQPTVPLNGNYYSLEDPETMKRQAETAKAYGLYGFCFYHYWFGEGRKLMEKPVENYLRHPEIDFPYCLCWANHNWTRTWIGGESDMLMEVRYGGREEWEAHFRYLLPFLRDPRYIRMDGKPVLVLYQPQNIPCLGEMIPFLQSRAREEGLGGLTVIAQAMFGKVPEETEAAVQYRIEYEPNYSRSRAGEKKAEAWRVSPRFQADLRLYGLKGRIKNLTKGKLCRYRTYSYDAIWQYILRRKPEDRKSLAGAFVRCDVTPRRQERALIYKGATPGKFAEYMKRLAEKVRREYAEPYIFLSAWNEWGEGMYLEPDEKDGYRYLEGVRDAVQGRNTVQDSQEAAPHAGQDSLEKPAKGL